MTVRHTTNEKEKAEAGRLGRAEGAARPRESDGLDGAHRWDGAPEGAKARAWTKGAAPTKAIALAGHRRLRASGGYRGLWSFQVATIIYDGTVTFCKRFVDPRSRLVDQMVQAARSGRQNIAEGSRASATSSQTELRLTCVARASLEELLLDYEDFLRQRGKRRWGKDDAEARVVRGVRMAQARKRADGDWTDRTDGTDYERTGDCGCGAVNAGAGEVEVDGRGAEAYSQWLNHGDSGVVANALICMIHQANYLLDRQIGALEKSFVNDGGYTEQLAVARMLERRRQTAKKARDGTDKGDEKQRGWGEGGARGEREAEKKQLRTARSASS